MSKYKLRELLTILLPHRAARPTLGPGIDILKGECMRTWRGMVTFVAGLGLILLVACGGSSSSSGSGAMNVHLVDGPISGYQEINVNIQSVEISGSNGWITLGTPNKTLNLLTLTGGVSETLASGATLPAGHYQQMRLILGSGNTVKLADGSSPGAQGAFGPADGYQADRELRRGGGHHGGCLDRLRRGPLHPGGAGRRLGPVPAAPHDPGLRQDGDGFDSWDADGQRHCGRPARRRGLRGDAGWCGQSLDRPHHGDRR